MAIMLVVVRHLPPCEEESGERQVWSLDGDGDGDDAATRKILRVLQASNKDTDVVLWM